MPVTLRQRMRDKKRKKQTALLIGGAFVLGCIGYWYYSSHQKKTDETDSKEQDESSKIEQITYAGDDDIDIDDTEQIQIQINKKNDAIIEESKEVEEEPLINDAMVVNVLDDVKDSEETEEKVQDTVQNQTESDKSNSPKEESPVMVDEADEDSEPVHVVIKSEENDGTNEDEAELNALIKKYDGIVDKVSTLKKFQYKNGKIQIKLLKATDMDKDIDEKLKVLVSMELSNVKVKSKVKSVGGNVEWNEEFVMNVSDTLKDVLVFKLMEHEEKKEDREMGRVEINMIDVVGSDNAYIGNRGFEVIGSKSGAKLYLDLMYSETIEQVQEK